MDSNPRKRSVAKRAALGLLAVVALFFAYREGKGVVIDWYADHYMVRTTEFPSSEHPDAICLTWSDDPRITQTIQWRTAPTVADGWVEFRETAQPEATATRVEAERAVIEDRLVENDPVNHRFTATLSGLRPETRYTYRVGSAEKETWSDWAEFATAPEATKGFSFLYLGDVQTGFDFFGELFARAYERHPEAAFCVIAGDLVNNGDYRDQWDAFFSEGAEVFETLPVLPALGNHDYAKEEVPELYLNLFGLPEEGPAQPGPERAYALRYGNTLFVVLDSNRSIEKQAGWLEEQLKGTDATWKIAVYHHPAFASKKYRDNDELQEAWMPLFDKYGLDLALQGHDHAYLRTYPMRDGRRAAPSEKGVVYAMAVAGDKYYEQEDHDYAEQAFAEVSTYQVIDITLNPDRLRYRAFDKDGNLKDEFTLEK
jgi:hypothetical protein